MITAILANLARFGRSATRSLSPSGWIAVAVLIALLIVMSTCVIRDKMDGDPVSRREVAQDQKAREQAADSRLADARQQDKMKEALNEAVASLPDNVPSDRRLALACGRLRNDGHAVLPPVCGPTAHREAPTGPG